jgi:D-glycero-beta-D-manno-heptose 1-phosphate adenylyltransferase
VGVGPHAQLIEDDMPVFPVEDAVTWAAGLRRSHKTIVFTNGSFDLLHPGHVRYLRAARAEGDALIVAVNSDRSVRRAKGPTRPINPSAERAEVLSALRCVDAVAIVDEVTLDAIIRAVRPDVIVTGAERAAPVGRDTMEARGGRVVRIAVEPEWSSPAIIEKIRLGGVKA